MNGWRSSAAAEHTEVALDTEPLLQRPAAAPRPQQQLWQQFARNKGEADDDEEQGTGNHMVGGPLQSPSGAGPAWLDSSPLQPPANGHGWSDKREESQGFMRLAAVVVVCIAWTCVSSIAILMNKHVMVDLKFKYPTTVAFLGLCTTTVLSYIALQLFLKDHSRRTYLSLRYYLYSVMPTGFMMALTFQTGNGAYLHLTVAFVQMLKAFCPVITMLLLFVTRLERATPRLVAAIASISLGVAMASYGELNMSLVGVSLMLTSVVAESLRLVMTQHLLVRQTLHPLEGLFYISSACSLCLMLLAALFEWRQLLTSSAYLMLLRHPLKFSAAALAGFGVNTLAILVIKLSSSLTLKVLGTVKDAVLVTVGVVFLREAVSTLQLSGYVLSLAGFVAYNVIKAQGTSSAPLHDPNHKLR